MSEKYLVTGGAGFIGSNIVEELLKKGMKVRVLDNFSTGRRENIKEFEKDIEIVEGDIRSYHSVNHAVKGVDIILHQAALPSVPRSIHDPITTNEVNVGGTLNIFNAAKENKVRRIVFASSSSVYGDNPELPKKESMTTNPLSPYAVSKLSCENYSRVFNRLYSIETIALRYFNVFGPKQDPTSQYSAVIPKFISAMLADKQPIVYGDGSQSRDFTYVANVVDANILAATVECNTPITLNCATHGQITINNLVNNINQLIDKQIVPIYEDARPGDIKHSFADISLIKNKFNWEPKYSFDFGLKNTISFINSRR
ncbi:MAG: LPS biosynthesis protein WbpP [Ignavibacteriae bacterium HGW-Ignavibacteriae-2]|jgi:UDP-glucose 4-epimerase|nr:SDR family oxidoreductase [Bacteroidota bacterium]PKL88767.1 MAG: LPS biosynthesis protein WbpP [Ignavibacteriae bacterium HGW-Ignavibacteriae-2]